MMTNGPSAQIGEILDIPFTRPRNRAQISEDPRYYELRNYALDFLFHRFAHDEDESTSEELAPTTSNFALKLAGIIGGIAAVGGSGLGII